MTEIDKGFDSLYVRIWYHYSDVPKIQVVEIRKAIDEEWGCSYSLIEADSSITQTRSFKRSVTTKFPYCGWKKFTDSLFKFNVTTLRSWKEIPSYESMTDGDWVHVEVAVGEIYRLYSFNYLKANSKIQDAVNMREIIRLISNEMGVIPFSEI